MKDYTKNSNDTGTEPMAPSLSTGGDPRCEGVDSLAHSGRDPASVAVSDTTASRAPIEGSPPDTLVVDQRKSVAPGETIAASKAAVALFSAAPQQLEEDYMSDRIADKYALEMKSGDHKMAAPTNPNRGSHTTSTRPLGDSTTRCFEDMLAEFTDAVEALPDTISRTPSNTSLGPGAFPIPGTGTTTTSPQDIQVQDAELAPTIDATIDPRDGSDPEHGMDPFQDTEVMEGEVIPDRKASSNHRFGWLLIVAMVLLFITVIVSVLQPWKQQTDPKLSDSSGPTEPPTMMSPQATLISEDLPLSLVTAIQEDITSPFYKANQWVLEDPNLDAYLPERKMTRFYLAVIFFATNGHTWLRSDHWLSYNISECDWYSSSSFSQDSPYFIPHICDDTGALTSLSLAFNNLTGTLPIWYTQFIPHLRVIDFGHNHIGGHLPIVQSTPNLEVMFLSQNPFGGVSRLELGAFFEGIKVIGVDGLHLSRAHMGGRLMEIMPNLEVMNMTGVHNYDGPLYAHMGEMPHLEYAGYGHTETKGTIPTEFGLSTSLRELDLSSLPYLLGTIPSELGMLTQLTKLDLSNTPGMSGTVPVELCQRVESEQLDLLVVCGEELQCCI